MEFVARYWEEAGDGRLRCTLCPRFCALREGQRGMCFVRKRVEGEILLDTYGRSSGFCVDPIEKKPLNHFLPGTPVLSFGTAGCNLACKFCQNHDISTARDFDALGQSASPLRIAQKARQLGCASVAYTYNDPVIFIEYAVDVARACRALGVKNVAVTAGYMTPEARPEFFDAMDAVNIDLKGFTDRFYQKLTGARIAPVLDSISHAVHEAGCWVELTTLLIPGENDSAAEIRALCDWVYGSCGPDVPLHFTGFTPQFRMLDHPKTSLNALLRAREIAREAGLRHVYVGNVHHEAGQSSYCAGCGACVIGRDWSALTRWQLDDRGRCLDCGTRLPGVFDGPPGTWGRNRLSVDMGA